MTRVIRHGHHFRQAPAAQARIKKSKAEEKARIAKAGATTGEDVEEVAQPEQPLENPAMDSADAHEAAHASGWIESEQEADERAEAREEAEKEAERKEAGEHKGPQSSQKGPSSTQKGEKDALGQKPTDDFYGPKGLGNKGSSSSQTAQAKAANAVHSTEALSALKTAQALGNEQALKHPKTPDAFTAMHAAQPPGVFFKEDSAASPDPIDPELAAAVEETVKLMNGAKGVLRIGPGRNEADEPVVVIVAGHGFGEASMRVVPEKVHRFETLLALPYEILPLKKDRTEPPPSGTMTIT